MPKYFYIILLLLLFPVSIIAQQNNLWYFGRNAGLDFTPGGSQTAPVALSNGALNTNEGSASICDQDGNLLFYSNGVTIYNRNHQVMQNGNNLLGNNSSVQACIIVPVPGNDSLYYVFATDAVENGFANGYTYSIVNMNRDNGNGEVITKNVLLWSSCTERMVAARHANGRDVWLITNDNNSDIFRAWLIDCNGLQPSPVVSNVGLVMNQHFIVNTGMIKVSPDGKQLCQTHFPEADVVNFTPNFCQLFDFNNATGSLSNARTITFDDARFISCEFSGDSKLLYLSSPDGRRVDQVECTLTPASAIMASRIPIPTGNARYYGIQLAPDEKIYLSDIGNSLGVINKPNTKGLNCDLRVKQVILAPGGSRLGLPAYINDLSVNPSNGFTYTITDSCNGTVQFNGLTTMPGPISWAWDFGDGNTSAFQNPLHTFTPSNQSYKVTVEITALTTCGYIKRSKTLFPGGLAVTADFDFTAICTEGKVTFNNLSVLYPDNTGVNYLWTFGDGNTSTLKNPEHTYAPGTYQVRLDLITTTPCLNRSVTKTLNLDVLSITVSPDVEIDVGQSAQLNVTGGGVHFSWSPTAGLSNPSIPNPVARPANTTTYIVTATNDAGCKAIDSIRVVVKKAPGVYVPTGFTPNNDGKNDIIRPSLSDEFDLLDFSIFNRWGEKIYSTSRENAGWNGKINGIGQDSGVYVWVVTAVDNRNGQRTEKKGTFVLIR